jgi:hypothetical protein
MDERRIFVVVRRYSYDKDDYICAYLDRTSAEDHRDRLNGEPYDPDDVQDHAVWTIPLGEHRRVLT